MLPPNPVIPVVHHQHRLASKFSTVTTTHFVSASTSILLDHQFYTPLSSSVILRRACTPIKMSPICPSLYCGREWTRRIMRYIWGRRSSTNLLQLPDELLLQICEYYCWHCQGLTERHLEVFHGMCPRRTYFGEKCVDKTRRGSDLAPVRLDGYSLQECWRTLSRLSRSCRRLREIAQPILHHSIFVSRGRLPLLVRTVVSNSALASEIRDLYVHGETYSGISDVGVQEKATLTSILIQKAVSLQRLHLGFEEPAVFSALFQAIASWLTSESGQGHRQQLEYISLDPEIKHWMPRYWDPHDQGRMIDCNEASPLFRLAGSGLRTLRCRSAVYPTLTSGLNLDNIVELSLCQDWAEVGATNGLGQCVLTLARLRDLLRAVGPGLQRFSISRHRNNQNYQFQPTPDDRLVELQDLLELLLPWKETLRELVFEGDLALWRNQEEIIVRSGLGDLAQFGNLEVLAIRGREYFDNITPRAHGGPVRPADFIAALSRRLRHLRISGVDIHLVHQVLHAISDDAHQNARIDRQFPRLRLVQVDAGLEKYWNYQYFIFGGSDVVGNLALLDKISRLGRDLSPAGVAFDRWQDLGWRDKWLQSQYEA